MLLTRPVTPGAASATQPQMVGGGWCFNLHFAWSHCLSLMGKETPLRAHENPVATGFIARKRRGHCGIRRSLNLDAI